MSSSAVVNTKTTATASDRPAPMSITFHRAIDMCPSPLEAVSCLISLGIPRVLSSGGRNTALEGADCLAAMVELVQRRGSPLVVMAGGGVRPNNVVKLVRTTGVLEVHASARGEPEWSAMRYRQQGVFMGGSKENDGDRTEYTQRYASQRIVRSLLDKAVRAGRARL